MRTLVMCGILVAAASLTSAADLTGGVGFSDVAVFTHSRHLAVLHLGTEADVRKFRLGGALTKEGFRGSDGWGLEVYGGQRQSLPWGFTGTARVGVIWTMPTIASGRLDYAVDESGNVQRWRWRTIRQNSPFMDSFTLMPFAAYGVRSRPWKGKFFAELQVRIAIAPTSDIRYDRAGRNQDIRWIWFVPGYRVAFGRSF